MVVGIVIDNKSRPICCEMWPGNTADVKTLIPIALALRRRFQIGRFCIVSDRGMVSAATLTQLEQSTPPIPYIVGTRMRKVKEIRNEVLGRGGRYKTVYCQGSSGKEKSALMVKEVHLNGSRYIVCVNPDHKRKDAHDRAEIVDSLEKQITKGAKNLV